MKTPPPGGEKQTHTPAPAHPDTLRSKPTIAISIVAMVLMGVEFRLREQTLELQKTKLGTDHPQSLRGMHNLAVSYDALDRQAEALIGRLGLDPALAGQAIDDPSTHDEVRADHDRVTRLGGWGVPTLVFCDEQALFGPVLIEPPTGEAAVRLWRLLTGWLEFPSLYEVQRPKRPADLQAIATTFRPYLEARDWVTIQKETP